MIERRRFPRVFFGWWTVLASGTLGMWAVGYHTYGLSAMFKPISAELGFSRAATSVAASIGNLVGTLEGLLIGWLTDRFGPRWIVLFGVFLTGLSFILMRFINSLWGFYLVWGVILGMGYNVSKGMPVDKAINNWFVKKRGKAQGIRWVLDGLGGTLVLPFIAWLLSTQGWRMTIFVGGVVMLVVGLPLIWLFVRQERPEYYGLLPDGATTEAELARDTSQMIDQGVKYAAEVEEVEFTLRQAMRTPAYWLLTASNILTNFSVLAVIPHLIPFLTDVGIEPLRAAGILAIATLVGIPSRLAGGLIIDRVKKQHLRFLLGGTYLLQAVGITAFLLNQSIAMIYVWFILRGIGMGASFPLMSPIRARYFGRKAFGSISGSSAMFTMPFGILSPIYFGWIYDTTGSYITAFILVAALLAVATVLAPFILPPKPPAQITDVRKFM